MPADFPCRISSGTAAASLGIDPKRTPYQLVRRLIGQGVPDPTPDPYDPNDMLNRGNLLEPSIIPSGVMLLSGMLIQRGERGALPLTVHHLSAEPTTDKRGRMVRHPTLPAECHPDFVIVDAWGRAWVGDAKSSAVWGDYEERDGELWIPERALVQFNHIWAVVEAEGSFGPLEPVFLIPVCLLGRREPFQMPVISIDRGRCAALLAHEYAFLDRYVWPLLRGEEAEEPPLQNLADVRLMFPQPTPGKPVTVDASIETEIREYWRDRSMVTAYTSTSETRKGRIAMAVRDAELIYGPDGKPLAKWGAKKNGDRMPLSPWNPKEK